MVKRSVKPVTAVSNQLHSVNIHFEDPVTLIAWAKREKETGFSWHTVSLFWGKKNFAPWTISAFLFGKSQQELRLS